MLDLRLAAPPPAPESPAHGLGVVTGTDPEISTAAARETRKAEIKKVLMFETVMNQREKKRNGVENEVRRKKERKRKCKI